MINTSIKGKTWVAYKNLVAYSDSAFETEAKNHSTKLRAVKKIQETAGESKMALAFNILLRNNQDAQMTIDRQQSAIKILFIHSVIGKVSQCFELLKQNSSAKKSTQSTQKTTILQMIQTSALNKWLTFQKLLQLSKASKLTEQKKSKVINLIKNKEITNLYQSLKILRAFNASEKRQQKIASLLTSTGDDTDDLKLKVMKLQDENSNLNLILEDKMGELHRCKQDLSLKDETFLDNANMITLLNTQVVGFVEERDGLRGEFGEMKLKLEALERKNGNLRGELDRGSQRMDAVVGQNNKTISMLSIELSKYER